MNAWMIVAHETELAKEGDFVCLPWGVDLEVAVMRDAYGDLTAFDNRCPHRGARIFTELRGNRPPVCGYHGRCAKPEQLNRLPIAIVNGFVAVSDGSVGHSVSSDDWCADLLNVQIHDSLTYHSTSSYVYDCHWTVAIENALDREHVGLVHRDTLASLGLKPVFLDLLGDGSSFERFLATNRKTLDRMCDLFSPEAMKDRLDLTDYMHAHMYPYTCLSSTRGTTFSLQHYFPRADGRTNFISRLYSIATASRHGRLFVDEVAKFNARVFKEDADICKFVPPFHDGPLQVNESRIAHFRKTGRKVA